MPKRDERVTLPVTELERTEILGAAEIGTYHWCLHCERAYPVGLVRLVQQGRELLQLCPYDGCEGDTVMDAWPWVDRQAQDSTLPEVPVWGVVY